MLDGLDAIDWSRLTHAFGPADDVPDLLRDVAGGDVDVRRRALDELYGTIWHQGTVYEATAAAVPFLVELAARPGAPERGSLLLLLGLIAQGQSFHAVHAPSARREVDREVGWVRAARAAVLSGLPSVLAMLGDAASEVRAGSAFVAASLPEVAATSRPALRAALARAAGPEERAALGVALAILGDLAPEAFDPAAPGPVPAARLAALAGATAGGAFPPDSALSVLLDLATGTVDPEMLDDLGAP